MLNEWPPDIGIEPYYADKYRVIYHGDCLEVLSGIPAVFSAVVTDPPYELGFMGKSWDSKGVSFQSDTWQAMQCACLPGAFLLSFGGSRTQHRIACAIEDAGWSIRDTLMWVYGCLSEDTEVLTTDGFKPFHKLTDCDMILVYDTEKDVYKWETPQRWQVYRAINDTVYRIVSDRTDQLVSRNHRCLVEREGKLIFKKAEEMAGVENMPVLPDSFSYLSREQGELLLPSVLWQGKNLAKGYSPSRACRLDRELNEILLDEYVGGEKSCVEGRGNLFPKTRQLQANKIRSLPPRISVYGAQRWLCDGASSTGGSPDRTAVAEERGSPSYRPRPYQQQSICNAVCQQPRPQTLRVGASYQTTLARVYQQQYSGLIYCPTVSTGAFVARRNGKLFITGNSGFPKSLDIGKAIDKMKGVERVVMGRVAGMGKQNPEWNGTAQGRKENSFKPEYDSTVPATLASQLWDGYGTALKPAYEPIILAMNPVDKTFANNALLHGVAGLNIDECRVAYLSEYDKSQAVPQGRITTKDGSTGVGAVVGGVNNYEMDREKWIAEKQKGRFPANFLHDGSEEVLGLFPQSRGQQGDVTGGEPSKSTKNTYGDFSRSPAAKRNGNGSAARFFYCAKASKSERNNGCESLGGELGHNRFDTCSSCGGYILQNPDRPSACKCANPVRVRNAVKGNSHPTVKPLALMTYLCKLVKMPEYNLVLDPFCGSGTTLLACGSLGMRSIGIDSDEKSCEIAAHRCAADAVAMIQRGDY